MMGLCINDGRKGRKELIVRSEMPRHIQHFIDRTNGSPDLSKIMFF